LRNWALGREVYNTDSLIIELESFFVVVDNKVPPVPRSPELHAGRDDHALDEKPVLALLGQQRILAHRLQQHLHIDAAAWFNPPRVGTDAVELGCGSLDSECNGPRIVVGDGEHAAYLTVEGAYKR
jgi:hypothetical protein